MNSPAAKEGWPEGFRPGLQVEQSPLFTPFGRGFRRTIGQESGGGVVINVEPGSGSLTFSLNGTPSGDRCTTLRSTAFKLFVGEEGQVTKLTGTIPGFRDQVRLFVDNPDLKVPLVFASTVETAFMIFDYDINIDDGRYGRAVRRFLVGEGKGETGGVGLLDIGVDLNNLRQTSAFLEENGLSAEIDWKKAIDEWTNNPDLDPRNFIPQSLAS